jgi:hypothetical protein
MLTLNSRAAADMEIKSVRLLSSGGICAPPG